MEWEGKENELLTQVQEKYGINNGMLARHSPLTTRTTSPATEMHLAVSVEPKPEPEPGRCDGFHRSKSCAMLLRWLLAS